MIDVGSAVGYLMLDTSDFQSGFKTALGNLKSFRDKTTHVEGRLASLSTAFTTLGGKLTKYVTVPLAGMGGLALKASSDFESAFAKIKTETNASADELEDLRDVMEDVFGEGFGENFDDVASAIADVRQQLGSLSKDEMTRVTKNAIAIRDTFGVEVKESIRSVDTLMKNFGTTSEEAFDLIVKGYQSGLDFSNEFLDNINEYSVQFKKLGLDAEDMFKILESGAESGAWNLDKIGDAIKELSIRVVDGSNTTNEAFSRMGLDAIEMANKFAQGGATAEEAFWQVIDTLAEMEDPLEQNLAGVGLFGTMWEDLGPTVITQLAGIKDETYNAKDAMQDLINQKYDNFKGTMSELKNSVLLLGAAFGEKLMPYFEDLAQKAADLTQRFNDLDEGVQGIIAKVLLFASIVGPVLIIVGQIIGSIKTIIGLFGGFSAIASAVTNPVGLAILALTGLVIFFKSGFAEKFFEAIGSLYDLVAGALAEFIANLLEMLLEIVQTLFDAGVQLAQNLWNGFLSILTQFGTWIAENLLQVIYKIIEFAANFLDAGIQLAQNLWNGIMNIMSQIASWVWSTISNIVTTIINFASNFYNSGVTLFTNLWNGLKSLAASILSWIGEKVGEFVQSVKDAASKFYSAGADMFAQLWEGLKSIWTNLSSWVSEKVGWLIDQVAFWKKESKNFENDPTGGSGKSAEGSYASGLNYVPRDMTVYVHKGEAILTAEQNKNRGQGNGDTIIINSPTPLSPSKTAREFKRAKRELALGSS